MKSAVKSQGLSYAHFPGYGPEGKTCNGCDWFWAISAKKQTGSSASPGFYCEKCRIFADQKKPTQAISGNTPACKYFQDRAARDAVTPQSEGAHGEESD